MEIKYEIGDKVLACLHPPYRNHTSEVWLPGEVVGILKDDEDSPLRKYSNRIYRVSLEEGDIIQSVSHFMLYNPLEKRVVH